jgi:hypothetical protein
MLTCRGELVGGLRLHIHKDAMIHNHAKSNMRDRVKRCLSLKEEIHTRGIPRQSKFCQEILIVRDERTL